VGIKIVKPVALDIMAVNSPCPQTADLDHLRPYVLGPVFNLYHITSLLIYVIGQKVRVELSHHPHFLYRKR